MNARRLEKIEGPGAWTAADLEHDRGWVHHLTGAEIDELDSALAAVTEAGLADRPFPREAFPLPSLGPVLREVMRGVEEVRGLALLRGIPVERYDRHSLQALYWGLGTFLGEAVSQNSRGEVIASVVDRGNDHGDMNVRGYKTRAALGPHVDSCDMTTLLCLHNALQGGDSLVTSAPALYNVILTEYPEFLDVMYQGFRHDLRGEGVTGRLDELTTHAFPIFTYFDGVMSCAFNSRIMRSARAKAGPPLSAREDRAIDLVIEIAERPELQYRMHLAPGDVQIINNYSLLHARDGYDDTPASGAPPRELLRMWFRFHRPRRMLPGYGDRYNTGDRGGVAIGEGARYAF